MTMVEIPVDEALLASAGVDPRHAGEEFRLLAAAKLFELRRISLGQAAQLAALSRWDFIDALRQLGVSWSNLTDEQLARDITQDRFYDPKQQSSFTWAELDAREKRWMPLPWWCVWPRLPKGCCDNNSLSHGIKDRARNVAPS